MSANPSSVGGLSPEYALLGLIAVRPGHGYELHRRLETELGQIWRVSQSQAYSVLKRLEAQGDIAGQVEPQEGLPPRKAFHLTGSGRARFVEWLAAPSGSSARSIRVEFLTRLYFTQALAPERTGGLIDAQERAVRSGLERLRVELGEIPLDRPFNRMGLELRIRQLESILGWLEDCRTALAREPEAGS